MRSGVSVERRILNFPNGGALPRRRYILTNHPFLIIMSTSPRISNDIDLDNSSTNTGLDISQLKLK